jgi:alcohol dehydrogenase (cytochrome c)
MLAGVTPTAGGVLFTGGSHGEFSGKIVYQFNTGGAISGGVCSYQVHGRQYVMVASGNHGAVPLGVGGSPTVFVFALPTETKNAAKQR